MEPNSPRTYSTVAEAAAVLRVSTKVVYSMVERGCIPAGAMMRLGNGPRARLRFDLAKLVAGLMSR